MRTFAMMAMVLTLPGFAWADDADPEPPGGTATLRKLKGEWVSVRRIVTGGKELGFAGLAVYKFEGEKASYTYGGRPGPAMKIVPYKNRSDAFEMNRETIKTPVHYCYKIEKNELHLIVNPASDRKFQPDWTGKTMPVTIYKHLIKNRPNVPDFKPDFSGKTGHVIILKRSEAK